ncbi:crotonobetainyl-CoA:carnitine CoA-transferase CaiB-like acyl-CoA transferase [Sphingopyxis panaciterrae]|uniref:CaiB/BaiF CoA transferase family protein n=1 Tax=Sphingopyxis panaciterrae TaxID=363841 RepID=UPI001420C115|nr:CaiB/BaiF CoA-transferase family protein [Sphingopyxis panaciterrae]NIJ35971.1 crotonobetainyl-CoA:carnitine CoA-transferase CaiB-like acyl-CoA transferase [Sphingopyxis panaciterrae]
MTGALQGLTVVSIEQAVAAPLCTARLADGGARVIKIERAGGETARHYDKAVHGTSAYFAWLNRGKESIVADVKDAGDRSLIERMLARADIFVQNLAPGAAARLGLDAKQLHARFPALIAVDVCGYAQDSGYADMRAYDMLVQAESGICAVTGTPDAMAKVGVSIADIGAGMNAHAAILEALIARGRSGIGRAIEVAMFDGMADWMAVPMLHKAYGGRDTPRCGLAHAAIFPYGTFSCSDGDLVVAVQSPAEWVRFCTGVMAKPELATDPRFHDNPVRVAHRAALTDLIAARFAGWTCGEAIDALERCQIAWGRVSAVADVLRHAALRGIACTLPGGEATLPRPAGRDGDLPSRVPALDEQGASLRAEFSS